MPMYEVIGTQPVNGVQPGGIVELDPSEVDIRSLVEGGHIRPVRSRPKGAPAEDALAADREAAATPAKPTKAQGGPIPRAEGQHGDEVHMLPSSHELPAQSAANRPASDGGDR